MRLKSYEVDVILNSFHTVFKEGKIFLFGSRVDDSKRGGDIDLFIEIDDKSNLFEKKIKFLAKMKRFLGEQKIDLVFNIDPTRLIEKEARKWAIQL